MNFECANFTKDVDHNVRAKICFNEHELRQLNLLVATNIEEIVKGIESINGTI